MALDRTLIASVNSLDTVNIENSLQNGRSCQATGAFSHAQGLNTRAVGEYSHADGRNSNAIDDFSYAWNGREEQYTSHGEGTFNINPINGIQGFYIGNKNLEFYLKEYSSSFDSILDNNNVFTGNNTFGGRTIFKNNVIFYDTVSAHENSKVNFTGADVYTKETQFDRDTRPQDEESLRAATVGYVFSAAQGFIDDVGDIDELLGTTNKNHAASLEYVNKYAIEAERDTGIAGLVKLYDSTGMNIDGTMTQKAIKEAIDSAIPEYPIATSDRMGIMYLFDTYTINPNSTKGTMTQKAIVDYFEKMVDELHTATESLNGMTKLYQSEGSNTDGTMTQKAIGEFVQNQLEQRLQTATDTNQGVMYLFDSTEDIIGNLSQQERARFEQYKSERSALDEQYSNILSKINLDKAQQGTFTADWIYKNGAALLPATKDTSGGMKLYDDAKAKNTDGTVTQKWIVENIPSDATSQVAGKVKLSNNTQQYDSDNLTTMTKSAILKLAPKTAVVDGDAGVMKMYSTSGDNTDGTMTQKAISEYLQGLVYIKEVKSVGGTTQRLWSNGWCEVNGTGKMDGSGDVNPNSSKINFGVTFINNPYVFATSTGGTNKYYAVGVNENTSTYAIFKILTGTCDFNWMACGFISQ